MSRCSPSRCDVPVRVNVSVVSTTHLLYVSGRWVEAVKTKHCWRFKSGRDAAAYLLDVTREQGEAK